MTIKLAVLGHPIRHSRSPDIHHAFAARLGLAVRYDAIDVPPGEFASQVAALQAEGYRGLNVTLPFKEEAFALADTHTDRALQAEAVNTLSYDASADHWVGDNTDGEGMVFDLTSLRGWRLAGARILVLGAGGAVRGVLGPLLAAQPQAVVVANRTVSKAENLVAAFATVAQEHGCTLNAGGFTDVQGHFDLIINGTSASLSAEVPPLPSAVIKPDTCIYDMMYGAEETAFNAWAAAAGARRRSDGLGMLIGQAAESFAQWTGQRPDVRGVLAQLRGQ